MNKWTISFSTKSTWESLSHTSFVELTKFSTIDNFVAKPRNQNNKKQHPHPPHDI